MAGDPERVGGSARKLGRCQEGTSPELLVAIAHNSTRECVCVHSFSLTRHDIWDLVFVNVSHLRVHLNLTAWQGSGRAQWGAKYLWGAATKAPTSKG